MAQELQITEQYELRPKQTVFVVVRCVVLNIFSMLALSIFQGILFVLFIMATSTFTRGQPQQPALILLLVLLLTASIATGYFGHRTALFGQGPSSYLAHKKVRIFVLTSIVTIVPLIVYCIHLARVSFENTNGEIVVFFALIAILNLGAYLFGQLAAVDSSAKYLKAAGQIAKG